jgi:NAD(P)-dependent dehydrogenase (short-subunit alcohol dehydrogenase family)
VDLATTEFGGLHVLYNNAGVSLADDDGVTNTDVDVWERTLRVNVTGVALGCKHGIPAMLATVESDRAAGRHGGASIVNVASFVAHLGAATPQIAYTASKGAVLSMTREIAVIHARQGIRANALCPGPVLTPLLAKYLDDDAKRQRRSSTAASPRRTRRPSSSGTSPGAISAKFLGSGCRSGRSRSWSWCRR